MNNLSNGVNYIDKNIIHYSTLFYYIRVVNVVISQTT